MQGEEQAEGEGRGTIEHVWRRGRGTCECVHVCVCDRECGWKISIVLMECYSS